MALSIGHGGVEQRDPEMTSPVAGNVVVDHRRRIARHQDVATERLAIEEDASRQSERGIESAFERGLEPCLELVNRDIYPADQYPAGQWEYQLYYQEDFDASTRSMQTNPYNLAKLLFRNPR